MASPTWKDRLRYRFDNFMSRGPAALLGGLGLLSLAVIFLAALIIWAADIRPEGATERMGFLEAAWESLMRTLDSGTMGGDAGWGFRLVMFLVTLGGIFVLSTLIGVITSGIESKMEQLRKGRSPVVERDHTVILWWSAQVFAVISELLIANANQKDACIVVLADRDKIEMEEALRERVGPTGRTRLVCRTGSPIDLNDLALVSLPTSKSIIILAPENEYPDADVIKTLLAVLNRQDRRPEPYHIVAELRDPKNVGVARMVGKHEVEVVLVSDLIARVVAQTCLQSGLSVVYTELLDFGGDEIYFANEPRLHGRCFSDALMAYEDSAVLGVKPAGGPPRLNPPMDTVLQPGDQLIVVSQDDDTIHLSGQTVPPVDPSAIQAVHNGRPAPQHILVLGWNDTAEAILQEIENYLAPGSFISVAALPGAVGEQVRYRCLASRHFSYTFVAGDTTDRAFLEDLGLGEYGHIVLLAYAGSLPVQQADAATMVTLLHLRDLADRSGYAYGIVSQILDVRNRTLAEVGRADDFIVSDKLASLMISQVAENKALNSVFADIFDPEGSEIYLKPAAQYVQPGQPVNFYTVVEAARRRGEVAFGYRIKARARQPEDGYGVVVNPRKSSLVTFADGDCVIVLAES